MQTITCRTLEEMTTVCVLLARAGVPFYAHTDQLVVTLTDF